MKYTYLIFLFCLGLILKAQDSQNEDINYSPYTVVNNFNSNLQDDNYQPKKASLSFKKNDTINREEIAIKLKKILDGRGIVLDNQKIPNDPEYQDSATHSNQYQIIPSEKKIYLEKTGDNWYFSDETVQNIPELYDKIYMVQIEPTKYLKGEFWKKKLLGVTMAAWVFILALFFLCGIAYKMIKSFFQFLFKTYAQKRLDYNTEIAKYIKNMARVLSLFIVSELFIKYLPSIQLPLAWNSFLIKAVGIASIIFLVLFINRLIDAIAYVITHRYQLSAKFNEQLIPIGTRILKILVWIFGIFYILYYYLNVDPTALIAGLSIGGLALALAAQDTVRNFLGSAIILIDKPFEINDWIQFDSYEGIVEEVGIRSTRVRSFEDSVIYVPNSTISSDILNNKGLRKFRRYRTMLGVEYDTSPETIDEFVEGLIKIIKAHPDTVKYNFDVHLYDLGESSIDILFNCFFSVPDSSAEFRARHQLISSILKLARKMGVEFAFPSRSIYIEKDNNFNTGSQS